MNWSFEDKALRDLDRAKCRDLRKQQSASYKVRGMILDALSSPQEEYGNRGIDRIGGTRLKYVTTPSVEVWHPSDIPSSRNIRIGPASTKLR